MTPMIALFIILIIATVVIAGFIVYVITQKSQGRHLSRIGRYRVVKELPAGGMSRIFLARRADDAHVIVKIPIESNPSELGLNRFLEEGNILSRHQHPHIVGLEEYGKITLNSMQTGFVALEYVAGMSLDKLIRGGRKFSHEAASLIVSSVADALAQLHKAGVYHRDISTNNIMLTYDGSAIRGVKLIDFGIAKWPSGSEYTLKDMMKEHYASPEQIARENLDGRSDIYSLGIVYYELITGRKPFDTWDRKKPPPSPADLGLNLPADINRLIMQMLVLDKGKRVQNAGDIAKGSGTAPLGGKPYVAASRTATQQKRILESTLSGGFAGLGKFAALAGLGLFIMVFFALKYAGTTDMPKPPDYPPLPRVESPSPPVNDKFAIKCPQCGAVYHDKDIKFCTIDGTPLVKASATAEAPAPAPEPAPSVDAVVMKCPQCGAVYHDKDIKFCTKDGTPLVPADAGQ